MTLTDIQDRLLTIAVKVEQYSYDRISEELMVLVDDISELENEVVGTLSGLAIELKKIEKTELPNVVFESWEDRVKFYKSLCVD